tara:strand:+ start:68 stop:1057 length:990 start_codon:yes stop_codon:yes gene_type:complete
MAATWGTNVWGANSWESETFTVSLTGFLLTSTLNSAGVAAFPEQGWGSDAWGDENWGESAVTIPVTGYSITASLGTLPYAQSEAGWGRDEWGIGNWGENTTTVVLTDSFEMTGGLGPDAWGAAPWNEQIGWGGTLKLTTTQLSIAALTGLEATGSVGTPTFTYDFLLDLTGLGPAQMGAGLGVPNINNGADHTQGVGSLLATGSVGSLSHEMTYPLTGLSATGYVGSLTISSAKLVPITASLLATGSLGSPSIDDMSIGLSGLSSTMSLGTLPAIDDMAVGLTGLSITGNVGQNYVVAYKNESITGSTAYSVDTHANTAYTVEKHIPNK